MNQKPEKTEGPRPTVVVIVPFYNGAKWIERAIRSVVTQTVQPDEFIIVNDGSKQEERAALGCLAEKYPFRIIDKENGGQGSARNVGVAASTSEYICFLDQDDKYLPMHIEDLIAGIPERDLRLGYVYADLCEGDGEANIIHTNMLRQQAGMHPKEGHVVTMLRNDLFVLPSASLIYRPAFEAVGGFDEQFMGYEDDDLFLRLFRAGFTNYYVDKPVTIWCMHSGSTSWSIKMSRSRFRYFRKLAALYRDDEHKSIFFLRDCLIPRFGDVFIREAHKAIEKKSPDAPEMLAMLIEYRDIVVANKSVEDEYKKLLARAISVAEKKPIPADALGLYQNSLHQCYRSTSWTLTRPLRYGVRRLRGFPPETLVVPYDEEAARIEFLRLKNSMSWRVSGPLRAIKRIISRRPIASTNP